MSKNFGHTSIDAEDETPATDNTRGQSMVGLIVGLILCATPLMPVGLVVCLAYGLALLASPVLGAAEANGYAQARTGDDTRAGCGLVLGILVALTVFVIIAFVGGGIIAMVIGPDL